MAIGYWLLAVGYWLLAVGRWLLAKPVTSNKQPATLLLKVCINNLQYKHRMRQLKRFLDLGGEGAHHSPVLTEHLCAHAIGNGFNVFMLVQSFNKIEDGRYKLRPQGVIANIDGCIHSSAFK
jgi:hypothetical protein